MWPRPLTSDWPRAPHYWFINEPGALYKLLPSDSSSRTISTHNLDNMTNLTINSYILVVINIVQWNFSGNIGRQSPGTGVMTRPNLGLRPLNCQQNADLAALFTSKYWLKYPLSCTFTTAARLYLTQGRLPHHISPRTSHARSYSGDKCRQNFD